MDESLKKLLVIAGASIIIFWIFKPKGNGDDENSNSSGGGLFDSLGKKSKIKKPNIPEDQLQHEEIAMAYDALCAYIDASNDGDSQSSLNQMKEDFKNELGIEIYTSTSGKLAVRDTEGNDILAYS